MAGVVLSLLLALVAAAVVGVYFFLRGPGTTPPQQMTITRLTNSGDVTGCTHVSPDGKTVVYCREGGGGCQLWVQQVATGATVKLRDRFGNAATTFSPDGNVIYVCRANGTLYVLPAFGGDAREVLTAIQCPVAVSPNGRQFAFVRQAA